MPSPGRLAGKVALVTGAGRGIGQAIALALAREGAAVGVNDLDPASAAGVAAQVQDKGGRAVALPGDISDPATGQAVVAAMLAAFDRIDILVNNAGITRDALFLNMSVEEWRQVLDVDLSAVFYCSQAAARPMVERQSGRIIQISSLSGQAGNIGQANYSAAKAGLIGLTKTMARELARYGITVNAIAPGFIDTPMTRQVPDKVREKVVPTIPLGRIGLPEEIASVVVFLASDESSYITGQVLSVNGGRYM